MGMAAFYGTPMEEADAVKLLHAAVDLATGASEAWLRSLGYITQTS